MKKILSASTTVLFVFFLVFNTSYAERFYPEIEQVIQHPGTLELIYQGYQHRDPPLASMKKVKANQKYFYVLPYVVAPSIQSIFLLEHTIIQPGEEVLDIGSGSGIQAVFAAANAKKVVATDLSFAAVENTRFNAEGHKVSHIVESRQGDLFSGIGADEKFDVIIFNIDYPYDEKSQGLWKVHERFFREVDNYLKPGGRIYYQGGLLINIPRIASMVVNNKLRIMKMDMAAALNHNREPIVYLIIRDPLLPNLPK